MLLMDFINISGFIGTILALYVTIQQIKKVKKAAEASTQAALSAQEAIKRNFALTDIKACIAMIDEIRSLLRKDSYEATILRTSDLLAQIAQLKHLYDGVSTEVKVNFKNSLDQLSIIQELLEKRLKDEQCVINTNKCNKQLASLSTELNAWLGSIKYAISKDN